ncbi:leucine--tRNA ligase [Candidatus Absconditicoccus praedator]|nr:leucine--tRNA ligase [Candidatus Absconditicoccus praedator]UFX82916.1 leucine--tRNA ligase [Candidatus Absconditicoccus praedator]
MTYDHNSIESKWQQFWEENKTFKVEVDHSKPKFYALDMFPYPSGAGVHVGHPKGFVANDIIARYKNANGYNVLHPMGWDAFGLPAENYAIKTGTHPSVITKQNIQRYREQIKSIGFSYDWDREIDTTDPNYYKWTQWIFQKMFENGLAYEQDLPINYCPSCKTGLANEEVLNDGTCERCGETAEKKQIRQWVLAITKYADRLLNDVDKLDWPESIKQMQRNWIGKSEGTQFRMYDENGKNFIEVYTTRIDTVFGVTYAVIAPDHSDVDNFIQDEHKNSCKEYINKAQNKAEFDRTEAKEKTGVFTGSYVINPFNNEKVPLWIGDYVLGNYGTGAVMAVPAHDERDYEFAKKYGLEIRNVVAPYFEPEKDEDFVREDKPTVQRHLVVGVLLNKNKDKVFVLDWEKFNWKSFLVGGKEEGESLEEAVIREVREESGYQNVKIVKKLGGQVQTKFFAKHKDENRHAVLDGFLLELEDESYQEPDYEETKNHNGFWLDVDKVDNFINLQNHKIFWDYYQNGDGAYTEDGILVDSGDFDGLTSQEARRKLTEYAEQNGFGYKKVNYKLRDWLFSRQRYWGEPIPLIHFDPQDIQNLSTIQDISEANDNNAYILEENGEGFLVANQQIISKIYDGLYTKIICDYNLPVELPDVEKFEPAGDGRSPLAAVDDFLNVKIANNLYGQRETNTMPQWGGSCRYYLRYMDPNNSEELVSKEAVKYWNYVDSYIGGVEHAVLHLLYARFWHKFLYDINVVDYDEPFYRLANQGLIQAFAYQRSNGGLVPNDEVEEKDGKYFHKETGEELKKIVSKMSKSLKNVENPDDIIQEYGADAFRLYEMYMGDFRDAAPWDPQGIVGCRRFLDKVWNLFQNGKTSGNDQESMRQLHKTIKKVTDDLENYKFNTSIAQMMILVNTGMPSDPNLAKEWQEKFLVILHPFAPHLAEELWEFIGNKPTIFENASWPSYDPQMLETDEITLAVQINGKLRGTIQISKEASQEEMINLANQNENVHRYIKDGYQKVIYVPGKIANFIVK